MTIQEWLHNMAIEHKQNAIANRLGVAESYLTYLKQGKRQLSFKLARKIYKEYKAVLYPFAEEALKEAK